MSKSYSHPLPVVLALSLRHYSTVTATALHAPLHTCTCATAINSTPTHCTYTPHEDAVHTCYTHIHTYIHTYVHAYVHAIRTCMHHIHTRAHAIHTYIQTHMLYACFICIGYMHTRTHAHTHTRTHAHTCMHTRTLLLRLPGLHGDECEGRQLAPAGREAAPRSLLRAARVDVVSAEGLRAVSE